jgi:hypothetical protein
VAKPGSIESKTGKFALASTAFIQILEAAGISKAHEVHAHIAREQHASRTPQQRDLSRTVSRNMDEFDAAGDGQYSPSVKGWSPTTGSSRSLGRKNSWHPAPPTRSYRNGTPRHGATLSSGGCPAMIKQGE